ncbi:MAG: bifunctional hydroxymethylpyrimidine kinase/phosphomethylpyrimidine kinase [Steroidobacteraceae bacterium]
MGARPAVLVIAGSDSSGGAGLVRDFQALAAFGVEALCALTAVTAQTQARVVSVHHVPPQIVRAQIHCALEARTIAAIKIGMLGTRETVNAVADCLARGPSLPVVLDPVLLSSSGGVLLDEAGREAMRARLFPLTTVLTPNIPEAAGLCGVGHAGGAAADPSPEALLAQARALRALGARAVLLKGGHAQGPESTDLLLTEEGEPKWLAAPRLAARCRGTGCALSSAIAARLAGGSSVEAACRGAKRYVHSLITQDPRAR